VAFYPRDGREVVTEEQAYRGNEIRQDGMQSGHYIIHESGVWKEGGVEIDIMINVDS
jgi:hypothetical protein